jgi:hypothetical protein
MARYVFRAFVVPIGNAPDIFSNDMLSCFAQHSTLEMIKDHHNRRMAKIEEMIEDRKNKVADHESGRRRLSGEEYEKAARQVRNFAKKLEQMKNKNDNVSYQVLYSLDTNIMESTHPFSPFRPHRSITWNVWTI